MRWPALRMRFHKYHALGNDYIVLDPSDFPAWPPGPTPGQIRAICHRNFGVGSDGILWGPLPSAQSQFGLRIFNPDGSEAEKSGNGLRIFSRYLWDRGLVTTQPFSVETPGGAVQVSIGNSPSALPRLAILIASLSCPRSMRPSPATTVHTSKRIRSSPGKSTSSSCGSSTGPTSRSRSGSEELATLWPQAAARAPRPRLLTGWG